METISLTEKYERNRWPTVQRPDLKAPAGWSLSLITAHNRVHNAQVAPNGRQVAFIWDREELSDVYTMPSAGGWPARQSTNRGLVSYWTDELPQWSPDSQWLAFTLGGKVVVVPAGGGLPRPISDFTPAAFAPVWMPDSNQLLISVERNEKTQLLLTDRDGHWPRPLVTSLEDIGDAQPSPDGQWVAFVHRPEQDLHRLDIKLVGLADGQLHSLVGAAGQKNWSPRWSPNGQLLAFLSQRTGYHEVWVFRPETGQTQQLTHASHDLADIAWSPDGQWLAATINRAGAVDLVLIAVATGRISDVRTGLGYFTRPGWLPDASALIVEYEDALTPPDLYRVSLPDGGLSQLTFSNLPALAANSLVVPERVSYRSFDGLEIPAFLFRPERPNGAAIFYPHGGPSAQYSYGWDILAQYFVAKGYTWLAANYRGSTGYGLPFEQANYGDWGQGDCQDCLHGASYLASLGHVDQKRIAIYGPSYGGYMVACCLSRDPQHRFACGVSKYGDANVLTSWAQCNRDLRLYSQIFMGHPAGNPAGYRAASPIHQVEQIQKPLLILHGLLDDVVPPQAAEEWVEALRRADKSFEYKTYANEAHGFLRRATQLDAYARIERFLDWWLI